MTDSMETNWMESPTETEWRWATFHDLGDAVVGKVMFFDPAAGATKYGTQEPCGMLAVRCRDNVVVRVTLDKPQLSRVILEALILGGYTGRMLPPELGIAVQLRSIGKYKNFAARCYYGDDPDIRNGKPKPPPPPPKPEYLPGEEPF